MNALAREHVQEPNPPRTEREAGLERAALSWLDVAMKAVKIAELKDRLSEYLRAVERGSEVLVTHRNRPIARIVPVLPVRPALTIVAPKVRFAVLRAKRWKASGWQVGSGALLAEERRER